MLHFFNSILSYFQCLLAGLNLNFMQMFKFFETTQPGKNIYQQGLVMN